MRVLFKATAFLVLIGGAGLLGFAIFSDLPAPTRVVSLPVEAR
jgi:hypothetical protein